MWKMNWKLERDPDKHSKAKKVIILFMFAIFTIVTISWSSQGFAATYIPPNSTISNGAASGLGTNTPLSSTVQCPPGHSPEYCSGYISGYNDALRSH